MSFPRLASLALPVALGLPLLTGACGAPAAVTAVSYGADGVSWPGPARARPITWPRWCPRRTAPSGACSAARRSAASARATRTPTRSTTTSPTGSRARTASPMRRRCTRRPMRRPRAGPPRRYKPAPTAGRLRPLRPEPLLLPSPKRRRRRRAVAPKASRREVGQDQEGEGSRPRQAGQEGFTRSGGVCPLSRKASRLSSALKPIALRVSTVAEPMWGSRKAFCSS